MLGKMLEPKGTIAKVVKERKQKRRQNKAKTHFFCRGRGKAAKNGPESVMAWQRREIFAVKSRGSGVVSSGRDELKMMFEFG